MFNFVWNRKKAAFLPSAKAPIYCNEVVKETCPFRAGRQ